MTAGAGIEYDLLRRFDDAAVRGRGCIEAVSASVVGPVYRGWLRATE